jgi:hypothetical protein
MLYPHRNRTLAHIALQIAILATCATAAYPQSQPQAVQPTSQGPNQPNQPNQPSPTQTPTQTPPANQPPPQNQPAPQQPPANGQPTPYTTPDGTTSIQVPAGWKVAQGNAGLIILQGSQPGEAAVLGRIIGAHNAPYVAGQAGPDNTEMTMPYAAGFEDKVAMMVDRLQVINGLPIPQGSVTSATPIPVPRNLGVCGRFTGNMTSPDGNLVAAGILCSMPLENAGDFKNFFTLIQVPATESATFPALTQQVLSSYTVQLTYLQTLLKPWDQVAGRPVVIMDPADTQCFNLSVLRATPISQLPRACGGTAM